MSDVEEPPTKVTKYEMSQTFTQVEEMEEGQEEWLSEGLLTDDDYNPENPDNSVTDPDRTKSDLDSQGVAEDNLEESMPEESLQESMQQDSLPEETVQEETLQEEVLQEEALQEDLQAALQDAGDHGESLNSTEGSAEAAPVEGQVDTALPTERKVEDANIEQELTNMDNSQPETDELDAFLMKNEEQKPQPKQGRKEESDGNDTDDLLRMLEDDDKVKKKVKITKPHPKSKQQKPKAPSSDEEEDEEEYILDSTMVKKLKVAQTTITARRVPAKAVPEDSTDDESSSGEAETMRKMFGARAPPRQLVSKQVVRIGNSSSVSFKPTNDKRPATSTPLRQTTIPRGKSLLKPNVQQRTVVKLMDRQPTEVKTEQRKKKVEPEEIIDEEEFMEEDDFDLGEDFAEESDSELDKRAVTQRIMRPERMDEDMLSDADSHSDDGSLYDELPSSESDDMDSWFTLDIRAERAGDYLPLLGNKAYDLLLQEKARVSNRLTNLRENLTTLNATGKQQADKLRRATAALAEVDDMLKAA